MSDTKASAETAASALGGSDGWAGVQAGGDVFMTVSQVMAAVLSLLGDTDATMAANSDGKFATQKAIKSAIVAAVAGLSWKQAVRAKATAALAANTYANGTSGVGATLTGNSNGALAAQDGVTLVANDRLLVDHEATGSHNGIYVVTQVGDGSHPYILTRATDADTGAELVNATAYVSEGTAFADTQWTCSTNATITVGTTALAFVQMSVGGFFTTAAKAWVDASGSDSTGTLGQSNLPFATINAALDALPSTGGDIFIGIGTFAPITSDVVAGGSTLNGSSKLKSYVRFFGSGMPCLDSETAPTTLVGTSGTVIKGFIYVHSTRNGVEFHNLGVDSGSAVCTALYSGTAVDGLVFTNVGQIDALAPGRDQVVESVRTLAQSATAAVHSLCVENCLRAAVNNVDAVFGTHGVAWKCVDGRLSNAVSRGHSSECYIFKESNTNNNTAPCHDNVASNLVCDQVGTGDTPVGISLQTASTRPMERLTISGVVMRNMTTNEVNALTTCTSGTPGLVQHVTINGLQTDNGTVRTSLASYDSATVLINQAVSVDTDGTMAANSDSVVASQKATRTYVDAKVAGLSWKQEVRAATTTNGTLSTAFANGQTIDGVTLATGDRILIKNQSTASANGIYTVNSSGAPTRATDADSAAELVDASVYVSEGTTNADTQWVCSTNAPITIGTTSLTFVQFSGTGVTIDTDGTMAADSDAVVPSQKAVVTYVATHASSATTYGGGTPVAFLTTNGAGDISIPTSWGDLSALTLSIAAKVGDKIRMCIGLPIISGASAVIEARWKLNGTVLDDVRYHEVSTHAAYGQQGMAYSWWRTVQSGDLSSGLFVAQLQGTSNGVSGPVIFNSVYSGDTQRATISLENFGNGTGFGGALGSSLVTKTGAYTMANTDCTVLADTTSSSFTITLPASPNEGQIANVKKIATGNTLTIARNGNNIDGAASDLTVTSRVNTQLQFDTTVGWNTL